MPDDPLYHLVLRFLCIPLAAFVVGALLYQFRFRAIWCLVLGETVIVLQYFVSMRPNDPYASRWLPLIHIISISILFAPSFAGYYFNKHILHLPD